MKAPRVVATLTINTRVACVIYTLGQVVVILRSTATIIMFRMSTEVSLICLDGNSTNPVTAPQDILKIKISAEYKSVRIGAKAPRVVATSPMPRRMARVDYTVGQVVVVTRPTILCYVIKFIKLYHRLGGNSSNLVTAAMEILKINI